LFRVIFILFDSNVIRKHAYTFTSVEFINYPLRPP
jgi:hypothetical protein